MPLPEGHHWWALIGFVAITLLLTWPIGLELGSAVLDLGDPLLNSWIWSWQVHSLSNLGEVGFFDTNIFYPHSNTLAYSELLLPQLVIAAPVIWTSRNRPASFTAGLVLAFCPFMFNQLAHVQSILAAGIPLSFLFLHRFLDRGRTVDAILFGLSYSLQALANTYYAVYLALFTGLYLLTQIIRRRLWRQRRFWLQLFLVAAIVALLIGPFYLHYFQLKQEMGFSRYLTLPASISSYFATPTINHVYGEVTQLFSGSKTRLFPGLVALVLAAVGLGSRVHRPDASLKADWNRPIHPRRLAAFVIPVLICIEYFSAPIPVLSAPKQSEFPAVYQWLAGRQDDPVFIAYPLHLRDERLRVFFSTEHRRRMVNGYSGFYPPLYKELQSKGHLFPSPGAVKDLQSLGVDLVLVDLDGYRDKRRDRLRSKLDKLRGLEDIGTFGGTVVYRIDQRSEVLRPPTQGELDLIPLDSAQLSMRASVNPESLNKVRDSDRRTFWQSPMRPGEWFELEWREALAPAALQLDISGHPQGYPRGYRVEISGDGERWQVVEEVRDFHPPIADFLRPTDFVLRFDLPSRQIRFLRFVQIGESSRHPWTVVEVNVLIDPS